MGPRSSRVATRHRFLRRATRFSIPWRRVRAGSALFGICAREFRVRSPGLCGARGTCPCLGPGPPAASAPLKDRRPEPARRGRRRSGRPKGHSGRSASGTACSIEVRPRVVRPRSGHRCAKAIITVSAVSVSRAGSSRIRAQTLGRSLCPSGRATHVREAALPPDVQRLGRAAVGRSIAPAAPVALEGDNPRQHASVIDPQLSPLSRLAAQIATRAAPGASERTGCAASSAYRSAAKGRSRYRLFSDGEPANQTEMEGS